MFLASRHQLESVQQSPSLRGQVVVDQPGADLDTAVATAVEHLDAARAVAGRRATQGVHVPLGPFLVTGAWIGLVIGTV